MSHGAHTPVPSAGHQKDQLNIRAVLGFWIFTVILLAIAGALTAGVIRVINNQRPDRLPGNSMNSVPPPARVEEWRRPGSDLTRLREEQYLHLHSTGWVDESHRSGRIPIDRAMQLIANEQNEQKEKRP